MIWSHLIALICLLMFLMGHQNVDAQQQLPFGAKARFGINKGVIIDTAFSPDRTQIAVASSVGIWLYDAATGTETALAPATPFGVSAIAFSPDGKTIAGGSDEGTIWLQRLDTGRIRHFPPIHTQHVLSVVFSSDGNTLASGSRDRTVGIWDTETGKLRRHLIGHTDAVNVVAFSPDGSLFASAGWEAFLLWDVGRRRKLATSQGDHHSIQTLAFSLDGETLVSGCSSGKVQLWDVATATHLVTLIDDTEEINVVAFSPDGKVLASWSAGGAILLWDWDKIRPDQ